MTTDVATLVPIEACRLGGGAVKFAKSNESGNTPIEMVARSPGPVDHWYWGRIVHDMTGMKMHKPVLTCDYEHWDPIGYLDKFNAGNEGLTVAGELVPTNVAGDQTTRILQLARGGVPFEASIYFDESDLVLEYVPEGYTAPVNGTMFEGPGVIAREWWLRGVAVCSYGYDKNTQSKFHRETGNTRFHFNPKEASMPTTTKLSESAAADATPAAPVADPATSAVTAPAAEAKPAETTSSSDPTPATDALSAVRAEMNRFRTAFGDKGTVYFADGISFEEASARHVKELQDGKTALAAENAELKKKLGLANQSSGEQTPVSIDAGDDQKKRGGFQSKIRFAGQPAKS